MHPDQRALPLAELAEFDGVFAYSFIVTNLDVSTGAKAEQVEHRYRRRTEVENLQVDVDLAGQVRRDRPVRQRQMALVRALPPPTLDRRRPPRTTRPRVLAPNRVHVGAGGEQHAKN